MDVFQVSHRYPPAYGGIENYAKRLTESLKDAGHSVTVVTTDYGLDGRPSDEYPEAVYCETTTTLFRNPISTQLYRQLRTIDADICHLHSPYLLPTVEAVHAIPDGISSIVTVHGFPANGSPGEKIRNAAYRPVSYP